MLASETYKHQGLFTNNASLHCRNHLPLSMKAKHGLEGIKFLRMLTDANLPSCLLTLNGLILSKIYLLYVEEKEGTD